MKGPSLVPQLPFSFRNLKPGPDADGAKHAGQRAAEGSADPDAPRGPGGPPRARRGERLEPPPRPAPSADPAPRVYSVSDLQRALRVRLENEFKTISVRGEVSNLRIQSSGHAYFTLKDRRAQLNCVLFAQERARLGFRLDDGLSVVATGRVTIYDRSGALQLRIVKCEPEGEGALWAQFQERARKLRAEGLTDPAKKRPLPAHPKTVGVVTSRTGAALRDVVRTILHRDPSVRVRLCHAQVQGRRAAGDLVSAIRCIDRFGGCDVLIVARGGGSLEDLWAFNEEPVARAIAACSIPVVVGVGHETDLTIADMVADRSASTPTAAATAAVADQAETARRLDALTQRLHRAARQRAVALRNRLASQRAALDGARPPLHRWAHDLDHWTHRADRAIGARLRRDRGRLRDGQQRLHAAAPAARLARARGELEVIPARLRRALQDCLTDAKRRRATLATRLHPAVLRHTSTASARLAEAVGRLEALSPLGVLQRGYALVRTPDGQVVRRAAALDEGDRVEVRVADGAFVAEVTAAGDLAGGGGAEPSQ